MSLGGWWAAVVLPWALESTLVGLLLLGVLRALPRLPSGTRVGVATLGLLKMLLPPLLLPVGPISVGVADPGGGIAPMGTPLGIALFPGDWLGWVAGAHLAGVLVGAGLLARQAAALGRARRRAAGLTGGPLVAAAEDLARRLGCRAPELRVSDQTPVPLVTGLWRPTVLLPAALVADGAPAELRAVLAHELAHLRSWDLQLGWLRALAGVLWWPSPVTRALARLQTEAMEERCDDRVLLGGLAPVRVYARGLLAAAEVAVRGRAPAFAAAATGARSLERRLRRLAGPRPPARRFPGWLLPVALALLLLPAAFSGAASRIGWTTRVLVTHSTDAGAHAPASLHQHRHRH